MSTKLLRANKEIVLLFAAALAVRVSTSVWQVLYGFQGIPALFPVNTWGDFYAIYQGWLQSVSHGMLPYRDFATYTYPPLFLYALYPFYVIGGAVGASFPIVVSDAATSPLVYLIVKKLAKGRVALAAGLMYALCPFALFYEGYLWLSSQPMTFFMILAIYLLRSGKPKYSAFSMAIAVLFKQEALFILPVYGIWFAKWFKKSVWKGSLTFLLTVLAVSLPFLILFPVNYVLSLTHLLPSNPVGETCVNHLINRTTIAVCGTSTRSLIGLSVPAVASTTTAIQNAFPWEYLLNRVAQIVSPILFVVELPALIASRRAANALELFAVYSTIGFLMLFAFLTNILLSYHYLPIYALLFASTISRRTLLVSTIAPVAALFLLPEGLVAPILPLVALLVLLVVQDEPSKTRASPVGVPRPGSGSGARSLLRMLAIIRNRNERAKVD
jgi:hypothetical protein